MKNGEKFISLKWKFSIFLTVFLFIIMAVTGQILINRLRPYLTDELRKKGTVLAESLASNSMESILTGDEMQVSGLIDKLPKSAVYAGVYDKKGRILFHTDKSIAKGTEDKSEINRIALESKKTLLQSYIMQGKDSIDDISSPMLVKDKKIGYVRIGFSDAEIKAALWRINYIIYAITFAVLIIGIIFSVILINLSLRAVNKLSVGVKKIGEGDLDFKVEIDTHDEIAEFAKTFNEMTVNLKKAQEERIEKEKMQHELKIAQQIQNSLLPKRIPKIPNFEIAAFYKSAKDIGGDYYDFIKMTDSKLVIIIADVSGKGVPGALGMATIRSLLKSNIKATASVAEAVIKANLMFREDVSRGMFVTVGFVVVDYITRRCACINAGHLPLIHIKKDGKLEEVKPGGIAMGLTDPTLFEKNLEIEEFEIKQGEALVMYTDGLNEAMSEVKEEYGMERLFKSIEENKNNSANEMLNCVIEDINKFTGGIIQSDDMTAVVIRSV